MARGGATQTKSAKLIEQLELVATTTSKSSSLDQRKKKRLKATSSAVGGDINRVDRI
jgi:hypothetical protein